MFTSNDTPYVEYKKALDMGAIINLDDITHIEYLEKESWFFYQIHSVYAIIQAP